MVEGVQFLFSIINSFQFQLYLNSKLKQHEWLLTMTAIKYFNEIRNALFEWYYERQLNWKHSLA